MDTKYINYILLIKGYNAYYFDENEKFSIIKCSKLDTKTFKNYSSSFNHDTHISYYTPYKVEIDGISEKEYIEFVLFQLDIGDSFEKFVEIFQNPKTKKSFLAYYVLKEKNDISYFFNEHGIFSSLPSKKTKPSIFRNVTPKRNWSGHTPKLWNNTTTRRIKYIIGLLNVGDSFDKFSDLISDPNITNSIPKPQGIDRFITKISKPDIYRSADNTNKNTFDFIGIEVFFLSTIDKKTAKSYIEEHLSEIFYKVKQILLSSKKYEKYGVPINFLKCSYKIDYTTSSIHFLFSLKELSEHNKNDGDKSSNNISENNGQDR